MILLACVGPALVTHRSDPGLWALWVLVGGVVSVTVAWLWSLRSPP